MEIANIVKHEFNISLKWDEKSQYGTARAGDRIPLLFTAPEEFGGSGTAWSPEHILAAAVSSCYTTTFFYFARLLKTNVHSFALEVKIEVEKEGSNPFTVTRYILQPHIIFNTLPLQPIIDNLLSKAKRYCIISNAVKGEITIQPIISCSEY